ARKSHGKSYNYKNPQRAWQKDSGAHCEFFTIIRKMTIPTRKADSRRSGYSPGLDSFQAIFPGTVFRFARRGQTSMITRYDKAIPLYQGLARSFSYCKCQRKSEPGAHEKVSHKRPRKSEPERSRIVEPVC